MRSRSVSATILAVASVALLVGCAPLAAGLEPPATPTPVATQEPPDPRLALSLAALNASTDLSQPGCSAAVGIDGVVVWRGARGLANLANGLQLTTQTRFDIASVSKQFTASAILMLQREGKLSIADPVGNYISGLPAWGRTITLEQLMHHTSHVQDYWIQLGRWGYGFGTPATQADALRAIAAVSKLDKGTGFLYSNSNYILLAEVVQRVTGTTLPEFLSERIFTPLGLDMEVGAGLQGPDIAVSYDDNNQVQISGWAFYGPLGILTTPTELVRWADQYRTGSVIGEDYLAGAVASGTPGKDSEGAVYGAGVYQYRDGTLRHDGRVGGYVSTLRVSADRHTAIAVMCDGHLADRFGLAQGLWAIWVDPQPESTLQPE